MPNMFISELLNEFADQMNGIIKTVGKIFKVTNVIKHVRRIWNVKGGEKEKIN